MATLFIRHRVQDYAKWREHYAGAAPLQKRSGVAAEAVYQADDDPTDVTVTHDFASVDEARAFAQNAELRDAMAKAGVGGAPTSWIASRS